MNNRLLLGLAGLAIVVGGSVAVAAVQDPGRRAEHSRRATREQVQQRGWRARGEGEGGGPQGLRERMLQRREAIAGKIRERLGITEQQREQFRAQAKTVAPQIAQIREQAKAILQKSREAVQNGADRATVREQTRAQLKQLFQRSYPSLQSAARAAVQQLTPEQRAKIEAFAAKHGKTIDQDRLERGAALRMLLRSKGERPARTF